MNVQVKTIDIDYFIPKKDAVLVYMKNGKCWVCQQINTNNKSGWTKLVLKGKSE